MSTLVLLRHGESVWNAENLFTGWVDVDLSDRGVEEGMEAGRQLRDAAVLPEVCHTSVLTRAIRTANLALFECNRSWIPVRRHWRLNERHYGALQGLNKAAVRQQYGDEQFVLWRRSYDVPPPPIEPGSPYDVSSDARYRSISREIAPQTECLKDVVDRMMPYWYDAIVPDLRTYEIVLVAAHGNSLRAMVKHLEQISDDDIAGLNIPTGVPRVYDLDDDMRPIAMRELGDADSIAAKAAAVAAQGAK